jgi:hypothetical protein
MADLPGAATQFNDLRGNSGTAGGPGLVLDFWTDGDLLLRQLEPAGTDRAHAGDLQFVWDLFGRRVSSWAASSHSFVESNAYTDSGPIAIRSGGNTEFEHQNWLGTGRLRGDRKL